MINTFDRSTVNKVIVLYHLVRASSLFQGNKISLQSGYAAEAKILMRSLLNLYINISWILKEDTESRLLRYFEMDRVYKHKAACNTYPNRQYSDSDRTSKIIEIEKEVERTLRKYGIEDLSDVRNWANKSIRQMAIDVGLNWEYDVLYLVLSDADHTGPISIQDYYNNNGNFIMSPRDFDIPNTMIFSIEHLLGTECNVLKYFNKKYTNVSYDLLHLEFAMQKVPYNKHSNAFKLIYYQGIRYLKPHFMDKFHPSCNTF